MSIEVDICTRALMHIGLAGISDLDDASDVSAVTCKKFYDSVLRKALRDHPWGFAIATIALTLEPDQELYPHPDFRYAYQYPHDCLRPMQILNPRGRDAKNIEYLVRVNASRTGKVILTKEEQAILEYVAYIKDPNVYDDSFVEMFEYLLASKIVTKLSGDTNKIKICKAMYDETKEDAKANASNESFEEEHFYNDFIQARNC